MLGHEAHFAVVARREPALEVALVVGQVDIADTQLLKAELAAPGLDLLGEAVHVGCVTRRGHCGHYRENTMQIGPTTWRGAQRLYTRMVKHPERGGIE